ncbi:MAG TPA: SDR family NAD(P)-dependent oxidoreductase [Myxococcales bacterium]|nr:SDR family NAD(P)-dependent oxidoreductase [Myxococcales bacterium]HIL00610.1 SDR family NAD(P)-dependent oxidoreductase [Myxococcales bacterium]
MQEFQGNVAVITGAASGIGKGLARQCAAEGMRVVLADVDEAGLGEIRSELEKRGTEVLAVPTDVRQAENVDALAAASLEKFGAVHLVFNNAGVLLSGFAWERTDDDWRWVLDVNLFGVINGVRSFMPILLDQGGPGHIVNTASVGGLMAGPFLSPYIVSKHAVVALTESVYHELATLDTQVGISVLCPGPIATGIGDSERIRPADQSDTRALESEAEKEYDSQLSSGILSGMEPDEVGRIVFEGLRGDRFWIYTHPVYREAIQGRMESILSGTNPAHAMELPENLAPGS